MLPFLYQAEMKIKEKYLSKTYQMYLGVPKCHDKNEEVYCLPYK